MKRFAFIAAAAVIAGAVCLSCKGPEKDLENDPSDFVLLAEAVPDAILEIRYYSTYNFIGRRIPGYEEPIAVLTRRTADSLKVVSDIFKAKGLRLKIFDAYRPQCAVDYFVEWAKDYGDTLTKRFFYPELNKEVLIPDYIAPQSGHTRGSTVDLTLFDEATQRELDMGATYDYFGIVSNPDVVPGQYVESYTPINEEQYANRMLLREVMLAHGFNPIPSEWWHFTLADEPYPDTYFKFPLRSSLFK